MPNHYLERLHKMTKLITIITPCYNCSDTLQRTWQSIKNQSLGLDCLECIFVDDASTDDDKTWSLLNQIKSEAPDSVVIIHLETNMRQGGARNAGLSYATGKYLMFLDSDDELAENACLRLYTIATENNSQLIQFNYLMRIENSGEERVFPAVNKAINIAFDHPTDRFPYLNASTIGYGCWSKFYDMEMVKKGAFRFAEHVVYEEPLFVYPCFLFADRISLITDALYIYNIHPNSTITSKLGSRLLDHPSVQLQLLEYCINQRELYNEYRDSIGCYFLWSYYCETICFAKAHAKSHIPLEYFSGMQEVCLTMFPDWKSNPQIQIVSENVKKVLESLNTRFQSQEELDSFIDYAADLL